MSRLEPNRAIDRETMDARWRSLYRLAGAGALASAALTVAGIVTYLAWPPPEDGSVVTWFALFQRSWLEGIPGFDLVMLLNYVATIPVLLALYVALRRASASLAALGTTLGLVSIATYFSSSRLFEMLALSRQYAAAATDAQRAALVAAGQSMLTTYLGASAGSAPATGWNYQGTASSMSFAAPPGLVRAGRPGIVPARAARRARRRPGPVMRSGWMMNDICTYYIRLHGQVGEGEVNAMTPLRMALERVEAGVTLFSVSADQSGLIGLLRHLHGLGLVVMSVQRIDTGG